MRTRDVVNTRVARILRDCARIGIGRGIAPVDRRGEVAGGEARGSRVAVAAAGCGRNDVNRVRRGERAGDRIDVLETFDRVDRDRAPGVIVAVPASVILIVW